MSFVRPLVATLRSAAAAHPVSLGFLILGAAVAGLSPVVAGKLGEALFDAVSRSRTAIEPASATFSARGICLVGGLLIGAGLLLRPAQRLRFERVAQSLGDGVTARILGVTATLDLDQTQNPDYLDRVHRIQSEAPSRALRMLDGLLRQVRGVVGLAAAAWVLAPLGVGWLLLAVATLPGAWLRAVHQREDHGARAARSGTEREAAYRAALLGSAAHAKDVRIFGAGPALLDAWSTFHRKAADERLDLRARHARREALADLLAVGTALTLAWIAVDDVLAGRAAPASLALRFAAIQAATSALSQLAAGFSDMSGHARHLDDLEHLVALRPLGDGSAPPPTPLPATLRLDRVSYRHPGMSRDAIVGADLDIAPGSFVAIRGENGAGKTTLLLLLSGLVRPHSGTVSVGGVDLATIAPAAWRRSLAVAWQDHARFELPVRDVLALGDTALAADDARLYAAISAAGLGAFIASLPDGLDTRIGRRFDGGKEPSAGLWQRLALARAFAKDAPIVLLDEPSAPLDPDAEAALSSTFASQKGRKTLIVVTHRPKILEHADLVVDVSAGRVVATRRN